MVRSFKEYLELPDFEGAVVKKGMFGTGCAEKPAKKREIILEPIKWYSFRLHPMIPEDMRNREVKAAAGELVKTMVEFLKEVVPDRVAVVCFEKQFHDVSLFLVAYEMKGFDVRYTRFLKDIPGFVFGWLYGGLLTLDHFDS